MIINVFDSRYPIAKPHGVLRNGDVVDYHLAPGASLAVIPSFIIAVSNGERSISLLRLCAHGNSGFLELGEGLTAANASRFDVLRKYFAPRGAAIEIHACGVGSSQPLRKPFIVGRGGTGAPSGPGYELLRALARGTGVPVTAAINLQGGDRHHEWEGMTITVTPDGSSCTGCGGAFERL